MTRGCVSYQVSIVEDAACLGWSYQAVQARFMFLLTWTTLNHPGPPWTTRCQSSMPSSAINPGYLHLP
ncbi:hypothetical protein RRG08_012302 [Elysia crispata]|uniref:Uncharacterized protein n=1 Tax=Elysia crispata TaxID=231223 RepID=A0AAE1BB01_9GAST|nr:hypothetical protein RRG08_012302 [Elysia crispata]